MMNWGRCICWSILFGSMFSALFMMKKMTAFSWDTKNPSRAKGLGAHGVRMRYSIMIVLSGMNMAAQYDRSRIPRQQIPVLASM